MNRSEAAKLRWTNPEYRAHQLTLGFCSPSVRAKADEARNRTLQTPRGIRRFDDRRKLTDEQVRDIRERFEGGEPGASIHKDYPWVSKTVLSYIKTGKTYRHIKT